MIVVDLQLNKERGLLYPSRSSANENCKKSTSNPAYWHEEGLALLTRTLCCPSTPVTQSLIFSGLWQPLICPISFFVCLFLFCFLLNVASVPGAEPSAGPEPTTLRSRRELRSRVRRSPHEFPRCSTLFSPHIILSFQECFLHGILCSVAFGDGIPPHTHTHSTIPWRFLQVILCNQPYLLLCMAV